MHEWGCALEPHLIIIRKGFAGAVAPDAVVVIHVSTELGLRPHVSAHATRAFMESSGESRILLGF